MANYLTLFITITSFTSIILVKNIQAVAKCSNEGPQIKFPFYKKGQQSIHPKNYSVFELLCTKTGVTTIRFPSYGDFTVKSISYNAKKLDLIDPKSCVHGVFLDLDLSLTLFRYYYALKSYTYLNCSTELPRTSFAEIPCLSGYGHHVYTVEPSMDVPSSCKAIKTIAIPFEYSPYLDDNSFGLGLTWDSLGAKSCDGKKEGNCVLQTETGGFTVGLLLQGLSVIIAILAVTIALLMIKTIYYSNNSVHLEEFNNSQVEAEKYLGDYKSCSDDEPDVDQVSDRC